MGYTITPMDWAILLIIMTGVVMVLIHWPEKGDNSPPNIRERCYVMGMNAVRIKWDPTTGEHSIIVRLTRFSDVVPRINDIITIIDHGDRTRAIITDISVVANIGTERQVTMTVEEV